MWLIDTSQKKGSQDAHPSPCAQEDERQDQEEVHRGLALEGGQAPLAFVIRVPTPHIHGGRRDREGTNMTMFTSKPITFNYDTKVLCSCVANRVVPPRVGYFAVTPISILHFSREKCMICTFHCNESPHCKILIKHMT